MHVLMYVFRDVLSSETVKKTGGFGILKTGDPDPFRLSWTRGVRVVSAF